MSTSTPLDGRQVATAQSMVATFVTRSLQLYVVRQLTVQIKIALATVTNTAVQLATAAATVLPNTPTYANGTLGVGATLTAGANSTLTVDGVVLTIGQRVLVKSQASALQNGIYTLTTAGDGSTAWVLTRATDADQAAELASNILVSVTAGSTNAGKLFLHHGAAIVMGTTAIAFEAGEPSGTITLEASLNRKDTQQKGDIYDDDDGSWFTLTSAQYLGTIAAVTAATEFGIIVPYSPFRRFRVRYAATTGAGVADIWITGQG